MAVSASGPSIDELAHELNECLCFIGDRPNISKSKAFVCQGGHDDLKNGNRGASRTENNQEFFFRDSGLVGGVFEERVVECTPIVHYTHCFLWKRRLSR